MCKKGGVSFGSKKGKDEIYMFRMWLQFTKVAREMSKLQFLGNI